MRPYGAGTRHLLRLDDAYLCNSSGSRNNDFLGDVRVVTLRPNADTPQGDFTPSSGSVHHTLVAEAPDDDGDASYVESGTVGHKDLYAYQGPDRHAGGDHGGSGRHRRPQG